MAGFEQICTGWGIFLQADFSKSVVVDLSKSMKVEDGGISDSRFKQICSGRFEQIYTGGVGIFLPADLNKSAVAALSKSPKWVEGYFCPADLIKSAMADLSKSAQVGQYFC